MTEHNPLETILRPAIHPLIRDRWSPRAFSEQPLDPDQVLSLFEAARWAPSGGNIQPWSFITAAAGTSHHQRMLEVLAPGNARWAACAPLLVLAIARRERKEGVQNPTALYDLGQAVAMLSVQATSLGIYVHQMGGFDKSAARQAFAIPDGYDPVVAIAIGYRDAADSLPEDLRIREVEPRMRKPLSEFVFSGRWGSPIDSEGGPTVN